jgi:hypothetical protein
MSVAEYPGLLFQKYFDIIVSQHFTQRLSIVDQNNSTVIGEIQRSSLYQWTYSYITTFET